MSNSYKKQTLRCSGCLAAWRDVPRDRTLYQFGLCECGAPFEFGEGEGTTMRGYLVIAFFALVLGWSAYSFMTEPEVGRHHDQTSSKVWEGQRHE